MARMLERLFKWLFLLCLLLLADTYMEQDHLPKPEFYDIKQANPGIRSLFPAAKWLTSLSLLGFILMFVSAPVPRAPLRYGA